MKKIINSIVAALILSVILTLFNPQWLFKNDARWTYQNDTARLDVSFSGHLRCGRIGAAGANLRVSQPAWLFNSDYQGTCVEMPVSYRKRVYQIKLAPRVDEWGTDAALVIKFMGQDFQYEGQRKPAWVCFRNISLNGQPVAAEKMVWHNKPFVLQYPHHSSEIMLTFEVGKPLAASDISYVYPAVVFLAFLLLILFSTPLKRVARFLNRKDIATVLSGGYAHIDPVYRRSFWIIVGVLCCAFGLHAIWFIWGNHDWELLDRTHQWLERAWEGRYMVYSIKVLLSKGVYMPLIYDLVTFVTLGLNAVLLCKYWRLEKRVVHYVLCGLVLTAQPFVLSMLYYVHMTPEVFIGVTCVLTALLLSEKVAQTNVLMTGKIVYSLIAMVSINIALAMYPVLINTIAVAFAGRLLVQSFDWDGSLQQLKSYLMPYVLSAINIVSGIISYKVALIYVFPTTSFYNTDELPMAQVPERLGILFKQCFHQLFEYKYPFISQWVLWVFLGFTMIVIFYICCTGNYKQKVIRFVLLFVSLFATQTAMVIARDHLIDGRVELFGLVFFEMLVMSLVMTRFRMLHNLSVIVGTCVVVVSVINDIDCLRMWKLGFDAEKMHWNRVLARLEIQKEFNPAKKYDAVMIGYPLAMRPRYYTGLKDKFPRGAYPMFGPYDQLSHLFKPHEFYYPSRFRGKGFSSFHRNNPDYIARLKRLYKAGVLQKADVWPKPNGLIVWKDIILFVTDGKELEKYKRQFERELGKK